MNRILFDTDAVIEIQDRQPPAILQHHAQDQLQRYGSIAITAISLTEITFGYWRKNKQQILNQWERTYSDIFNVIAFEQKIALLAAEISFRLREKGFTLGLPDLMIAATCLTHDLVLLTGNIRHFNPVVEVGFPLGIINWREG